MVTKLNQPMKIILFFKTSILFFMRALIVLSGAVFSAVIIITIVFSIIIYSKDTLIIKDEEFHLSNIISWYFKNNISFSSLMIDRSKPSLLNIIVNNYSTNKIKDGYMIKFKKMQLHIDSSSIYSGKLKILRTYVNQPIIYYELSDSQYNLKNNPINTIYNDLNLSKYLLDSEEIYIDDGNLEIKKISNGLKYKLSNINLNTEYENNKSKHIGKFTIEDPNTDINSPQFQFEINKKSQYIETTVSFTHFNPSSSIFNFLNIKELTYLNMPLAGKLNFFMEDKKVNYINYEFYTSKGVMLPHEEFLQNDVFAFNDVMDIKNLKLNGKIDFDQKTLNISELRFDVLNYQKIYETISIKSLLYKDSDDNFVTEVSFNNFIPQNILKLKREDWFFINNIPISGNIKLTHRDLVITKFSAYLHSSGLNKLRVPDYLFNTIDSLVMTNAGINIEGDLSSNIITVNEFKLAFKNNKHSDSTFNFVGEVKNIESDPVIIGSINIDNLDLVKAIYECKNIVNNELFDWLISNVNSGNVNKAYSNINISYSSLLKKEISNTNFDLSLELSNLELKLLNLDDVLASSKALFEYKESQITIISNKNTINKLAVNDIIFKHQLNNKNGKINFKVSSQLTDLIKFLEKNDIYKLNADGFVIDQGNSELDITLVIPFDEKFDFNSIKRTINGNLYGVTFKEHSFNNFLIDSSLEDLNLELNVNNNDISLKGSVLLNKIHINISLNKSESKKTTIALGLSFDKNDMEHFNFSTDIIDGITTAHIFLAKNVNGWSAKTIVSLTKNKINIPAFNYNKEQNLPSILKISTNLDEGFNFSKLNFQFNDEVLHIEGKIKFDFSKDDYSILIDNFSSLENEFSADIYYNLDKKLDIKISGKKLFLPFDPFEHNPLNNDLLISFYTNVDKLNVGNKYIFNSAFLSYDSDLQGRNNIKFDALYKDIYSLNLDIVRDKNYINSGLSKFSFYAQDSGEFFSAIGYPNVVIGGELTMEGYTGKLENDNDIMGTISIDNFVLKDAPIFAELLLAASLTGVVELLTTDGIPFEQFDAQFNGKDKRYVITKSRAYGFSLGFSAVGWVDKNNKTLDIGGTIVPVYVINSIFNNIPIIGELIIGREDEGIFGINYRANGSWDDIETSVNPFSAFTPGFLRRIFDFLDRPEIN